MKNVSRVWAANIRSARLTWGKLSPTSVNRLKQLTRRLTLSIAEGELTCLDGKWYVTHSGLLRIAQRRRCQGIETNIQNRMSDPQLSRWVFKATVYRKDRSRGFVGYGDADPTNVSSLVHGAELRIAETRAVNRALRKAYGVGLCSVEELGWTPTSQGVRPQGPSPNPANGNNGYHGTGNGQPRLRDRLCLLIRQHHLDANLVKAYAAHYCGTSTLREASRDMIEAFINDLALRVVKDREGLVCQLNSYANSQEVAP